MTQPYTIRTFRTGDMGLVSSRQAILYVEPFARGLGLGGDLVGHVVASAREVGYQRLQLWTHSILTSARRLYAAAGMEIVATEVHHAFGKPEQGETWKMTLQKSFPGFLAEGGNCMSMAIPE